MKLWYSQWLQKVLFLSVNTALSHVNLLLLQAKATNIGSPYRPYQDVRSAVERCAGNVHLASSMPCVKR